MGVQPLGQRVRRAAGGGGELGGGAGGRRQPDHPIAGVLPGAGGGAQRAGLARPSRRGQDRQDPARGQVQHRPVLARIQPSVTAHRHERSVRNLPVPAAPSAGSHVQDPGLRGQDLHSGVTSIRGASRHRDALTSDRDRVIQTERDLGELLDPRDDLGRTQPGRGQQRGDLPGDSGAREHRPPGPRRLQRPSRHSYRQHVAVRRQGVAVYRQTVAVRRQHAAARRQERYGLMRAVSVGAGDLRSVRLGKTRPAGKVGRQDPLLLPAAYRAHP